MRNRLSSTLVVVALVALFTSPALASDGVPSAWNRSVVAWLAELWSEMWGSIEPNGQEVHGSNDPAGDLGPMVDSNPIGGESELGGTFEPFGQQNEMGGDIEPFGTQDEVGGTHDPIG